MNSINNFLLMLSVLASFVITSCASHQPIRYDSQLPSSNLPSCFDVPNKKLTDGASCIALVEAGNRQSQIGLNVEPREKYKVSVPGRQAWFDATRRNTPLCGEKGSFLMNLFKKRSPESLWFSVLANVIPSDQPAQDLCQQDLCQQESVFTAHVPGELILYPNDNDYFYDNNYGKIWVKIEHQKAK